MELTEQMLDDMSQEEFDSLVENYDQLDELSKATLKSYAQKANLQNNGFSVAAGQMIDRDKKASSAFMKKAGNRTVGVNRAINKMVKEDISNLLQSINEGNANQVNDLFDKLMAFNLNESIELIKQELAESIFDKDEQFEVFMFNEDFNIEELDEDAGALKGLPTHIINTQNISQLYHAHKTH